MAFWRYRTALSGLGVPSRRSACAFSADLDKPTRLSSRPFHQLPGLNPNSRLNAKTLFRDAAATDPVSWPLRLPVFHPADLFRFQDLPSPVRGQHLLGALRRCSHPFVADCNLSPLRSLPAAWPLAHPLGPLS